jgi:hypothetical protein
MKHSQMRLSAIKRFRNKGCDISGNISYRHLATLINHIFGWGDEIKRTKGYKNRSKKIIERFYFKNPDFPDDLSTFFTFNQKVVKSKKKKKFEFVQTNDFLLSFEWRRLRMEILKKNDGRCECCGRGKHDGIMLHVDHIKPRKHYPELALAASNLQVLCNECNHGKGNWDETDWRKSL